MFLFDTKQPIHRHLEYLRQRTQLVIRYKARTDLNARNAVALNNDSRYLQARREIALRQAVAASGLVYAIAANILFSVIIIYFQTPTPQNSLKVRIYLDFNIFWGYNCVKDKKVCNWG